MALNEKMLPIGKTRTERTGDYLYCDGYGCLLRTTCRRYTEGERIRNSRTEGQWYWTEHCDPETRELYKSNKQ